MPKLRKLDLSGSYYDIGYRHGATFRDAVRHFVDERVSLSGNGQWSDRPLSREEVLAIAEATVAEHQAYAPELMEELQGMADAAGATLAELVIVNGFTDFVDTLYAAGRGGRPPRVDPQPADNCTAFIVPDALTAGGQGFFGQTWDMHASATPYVILLHIRPPGGPAALVFTVTGCVGMIGMNEAGIAVGINNLLGGDGQIGVTWPFVVRKMLQQDNLDDALACLTGARLAGAHNYLLYDRHNRGYNIEAMGSYQEITPLAADVLAHTNHCLVPETISRSRPRPEASQQHSEHRLSAAYGLLARGGLAVEDLMRVTTSDDVVALPAPPFHVETCGAAIMQPATGRFWAVWGRPAVADYEAFAV